MESTDKIVSADIFYLGGWTQLHVAKPLNLAHRHSHEVSKTTMFLPMLLLLLLLRMLGCCWWLLLLPTVASHTRSLRGANVFERRQAPLCQLNDAGLYGDITTGNPTELQYLYQIMVPASTMVTFLDDLDRQVVEKLLPLYFDCQTPVPDRRRRLQSSGVNLQAISTRSPDQIINRCM